MGEIAGFIDVVEAIMTLVDAGEAISDLFFGSDAASTITLSDISSLIQSSEFHLYSTLDIARMQTTRDSFYKTMLPTIIARAPIQQSMVVAGGELKVLYDDLRSEAGVLWEKLQELKWLFDKDSPVLNVDDYASFGRTLAQSYVLLLHMHSVILNLRSVELLNAVNLDSPQLLYETMTLQNYINLGIQQVGDIDTKTRSTRLGLISDVSEEDFSQSEFVPPNHSITVSGTQYNWSDSYQKLDTTSEDQALGSANIPTSFNRVVTWNMFGNNNSDFTQADQDAKTSHQNRVDDANKLYKSLVGDELQALLTRLQKLKPDIDARVQKQEAKVAKEQTQSH